MKGIRPSVPLPLMPVDGPVRGRGALCDPPNRFESRCHETDPEHLQHLLDDHTIGPDGRQVVTEVYADRSQTVLNHVDSPDLGFRWTINPYRGCEHGCIYCYARQYHEMLSFSCGIDFERRIVAKHNAPKLLRAALSRPGWRGEPIVMSGATDCYQPIERRLRITRGCLEVFAECRQAVRITTKNRLVLRDLDLLGELAAHDAVQVAISLTTLDRELAARMEPRASAPADRLWTIRRLASTGIGVTVLLAPIVPGLTDHEIPALIRAAADAGARCVDYELLRLPHQVKLLFEQWLSEHYPQRREHVLQLIRQVRDGRLNDPRFGVRMTGTGPIAEHIRRTMEVFARRHGVDRRGLDYRPPKLNTTAFRRPADSEQMMLFGDPG